MHEVLDGMRELGGERHEFYAIQLSNLAAMEGLVGNDERALTLFEESLALTRSLSPSPSRNEAVALGNLSDLLRRLGRIEEAVELGRQGAEMLSRTFGEESDRHANGRANLGRALMELERYGEAAEELERAVEVRRVSAPDHPSQGENAAMLAEARLALGEWDVAAEAARFAADALARSPSGSAHWVLVARVTEALALALAGDLEAGLPAAEAALDRAPPAPAGDRALAEAALGLVVVLAGGTDAGWERFDAATPDFASGDARTRRIRALAAIVEERAGR
jgi:tetratricopeptide (TPR) repeat protein